MKRLTGRGPYLRRFAWSWSSRIVLIAVVVGCLGVALFEWVGHFSVPQPVGRATESRLTANESSRDFVNESCLMDETHPNTPEGCRREWAEGRAAVDPDRFHFTSSLGLLADAGGAAILLGVILGAIFGGWATKHASLLIQWTPNRRQFHARTVLSAGSVVMAVSVIGCAAFLVCLAVVSLGRGTFFGLDAQWATDAVAMVIRIGAVAAIFSVIGATLAHLTGSTVGGVGLGMGVVLLSGLAPRLLVINFLISARAAIVTSVGNGTILRPSTLQAFLSLVGPAVVLFLISSIVFVRRDL